ncbi:hypothetical protein BDQ17DRAFT_893684 [Cyathus striatus]|nr:hypothetical protein BDQ17DRAFT_893684 [Cyathus striatus]
MSSPFQPMSCISNFKLDSSSTIKKICISLRYDISKYSDTSRTSSVSKQICRRGSNSLGRQSQLIRDSIAEEVISILHRSEEAAVSSYLQRRISDISVSPLNRTAIGGVAEQSYTTCICNISIKLTPSCQIQLLNSNHKLGIYHLKLCAPPREELRFLFQREFLLHLLWSENLVKLLQALEAPGGSAIDVIYKE